MAKVIGDISNNAISIATYNEREKINKLGLEKFKLEEQAKALKGQAGNEQQLAAIKQQLTNVQAEITKTQGEIDRTYGIGSKTGMAIRAVTAALQAAAQNDTAGSLVALASPYLNKTIHEMTAGDTAKDKATNLMAHALLSAVEFQVTGKDPLTGAVAGVTGEVTAQILTQAIYNKTPNQLTANEKENISTLSQLAGGLAAALTAKANGTTAEQGGNFLAATSGAGTAKSAVENNYLSVADVENLIRELSKAQKEGRDTKPILEKYKGISEENRQQLIACKGNVACETAHLHEMNTGGEELERNLGFFSRMTVYYPNDLNTANRIALSNLVESEYAESFSKLSDTTKFGLNLMEASTAMGFGAAAGYAKVGLSKVKSLISGKNKAYPTSGMDGYKRANVGSGDYPDLKLGETALINGVEHIRVGRWMSTDELSKMKESSKIVSGGGGLTFISLNGIDDYKGAAKPGSVYVEFNVPKTSLLQGGKDGWFKMVNDDASNSQKNLLQKKGGILSPDINDIRVLGEK